MSNTPISTCSGTYYDPGGSSGYANSSSFTQTFSSADGDRLVFNFTQFSTYDNNDYLIIYDGSSTTDPVIGNFSGSNSPGTFTSTGTSITFKFVSNSVLTGSGWTAMISCTTPPPPRHDMSSGTVTACSGIFYDDGGPHGDYTASQERMMTFCSGTSDQLQFNFDKLRTELWWADSLFVYDGADINSPLISIYVALSEMETITSTGSCVTFRFKSDAAGNESGWAAEFTCVNASPDPVVYKMSTGVRYVCSGVFQDDGGVGNYSGNGSPTQTFVSSNGKRLIFDFTAFATANSNHVLSIYDGPTTDYTLLGTYSTTGSPGIIISSGNSLTIKFNPSGAGTASGWNANISCSAEDALTSYNMSSGTVTACSGVFYDDGGPTADYSFSQDKVMTFCSGSSDMLEFTFNNNLNIFTALDIRDTLLVYDGEGISAPLIGIYMGYSIIEKITSSGSCLTFRFKSDGFGGGFKGWQAVFRCVSSKSPVNYIMSNGSRYTCSGTFTDDGGTSGNYQDFTSSNRKITFVASDGCAVKVTFNSFSIHSSDNLKVYDGPDISSTLLGTYTNTQSGLTFQSTGSAITFQLNLTGGSTSAAGWNATVECVSTVPVIAVTSNSPVCKGSNIELSVTEVAGAAYSWTGPDGFTSTSRTPSLMALVNTAGTYNVTVTKGTCSAIGNADIIVTSVYSLSATSNSPVCEGGDLNLEVGIFGNPYTTGDSYFWTCPDGFTASVYNPTLNSVTPTAAGTYTATVTYGGCTTIVNTTVVVKAKPSTPTTGSNSPICEGGLLNLTASSIANATYSWIGPEGFTNTNQNASRASVSTLWAGDYSVTAMVDECSSDAATVNVIINTIPSAPSAGSNSPVCVGSAINLTASNVANATYSWTGPDGFASSDQNPVILNAVHPDHAGNYIVYVSVNGCQSSGSLTNVVLTSIPNITASNDGSYCAGEDINLTAMPNIVGASYSWSGPDGFTSSDRNPVITNAAAVNAGTYQVTVMLSTCSDQASTVVVVNTPPAKPTISFVSAETKLSSSSATANQWYKDGVLMNGQNNQDLFLSEAGSYTVKVIDGNGCSSAESDPYIYTPTGVKFQSNLNVAIYPNPASSFISLKGDNWNVQQFKVKIFNILGESKISYQVDAGGSLNEMINVSDLEDGMYLVEIETASGLEVHRVVIKK